MINEMGGTQSSLEFSKNNTGFEPTVCYADVLSRSIYESKTESVDKKMETEYTEAKNVPHEEYKEPVDTLKKEDAEYNTSTEKEHSQLNPKTISEKDEKLDNESKEDSGQATDKLNINNSDELFNETSKEKNCQEDSVKEVTNGELSLENDTSPSESPQKSDLPPGDVEDRSVQTQSTNQVQNKKAKKKDKSSAEEKKLVDLLVHVFDGLETPEKKMEALAKKYIQLAADMKSTESKLEDVEGKHKEVKREKEQLQLDFGKVNMAKTKLESLCRELQKQNKIIKEEIQRRTDEEDRKRRELSQKFQSTINDITTQMGENHKRNQQLKQDNTDLAQKLKGLVEQYEVREQHIEKVLKAKQLELQLCEAKLQQQTQLLQEERQNNMKEKHGLLQDSLEQKKKVEMLLKQEAELKGQLSLYTEKFVEFQSTLTKSNEVFATFKKEMDKMTKTIRKLEKESNTWKTRYENTNVSLIQMVEERTQKDNDIMVQKGKIEKLEKLCRALQAERRKLKKELEQYEKPENSDMKTANEEGESTSDSTPEPPEIDNENQCTASNNEGQSSDRCDDDEAAKEHVKKDADQSPCEGNTLATQHADLQVDTN